ncbi:MAG TPA: serine acetyltransferase [Bacteroidales bacterium]
MGLRATIKEDFKVNSSNTKGKFVVLFFRLSGFFCTKRKNPVYFIIGIFFRSFYRFFVQWTMGIDLPEKTKIGKGLCIYHGQGLVVNEDTIFGDYVTLRQNTTIGNKTDGGRSPVFGNHINIGANSVIIGDIDIGDNVTIGAASVVIKDVPSGVVVVGNPAKIIKQVSEKF